MFVLHMISSGTETKTKKTRPDEESPYYTTALLLYHHNRFNEALKELTRISTISSKRIPTILKIKCLINLNRLEDAKIASELAREIFPGDSELLYIIADLYKQLDAKEKAKEILQNIITLDPKNAFRAYINLQDLFIKAGNWMDAMKMHEDIAFHFPHRIDARLQNIYYGISYKLSMQFIENGNYKEALFYARELQESNELFSLTCYLQAKVYYLTKDDHNFTKTASKGILKTKSYALLKLMEDYYLAQFNPSAAIEFYKNIIYESRRDKIIILAFGLFYQRLEMIEDALGIFQQLHKQYPHWHEIALLKAQMYFRLQDTEKALSNFEEYFSHNNLPALFKCAKCGHKSFSYMEKCEACGWWDSIALAAAKEEEISVEPVMWAETIF
ncbi:MAG: hypothetical protein A2Y62_20970 [Candidatus Fischerbacteria bacterium RBG_13_37_8]|uniref:LapB rubredoxin metal binding domain-containing protein n=1 Tax=Candidatus Fischerbacteria bacterium RBG_13_37_8 TaxID=1817863 RepID=A0A1F5VVG2_9BACT|nr:MAG: hypothetical protein A2Y62_20970 [Candidatus Fischerbacteria bacterium RBG_13_37_8]